MYLKLNPTDELHYKTSTTSIILIRATQKYKLTSLRHCRFEFYHKHNKIKCKTTQQSTITKTKPSFLGSIFRVYFVISRVMKVLNLNFNSIINYSYTIF